MQLQLNKILTELGLITTIGVGILILKNKPVNLKNNYKDYKMLSQSTFPEILEAFRNLEEPNDFEELCLMIEYYLETADQISSGKFVEGGQFLLNRLCEEVIYRSKQMIFKARSNKSNDVLTVCIDCERDELTILTSNCQNILRNVLLSNNH